MRAKKPLVFSCLALAGVLLCVPSAWKQYWHTQFPGHVVTCVAFSPDGKTLAGGGYLRVPGRSEGAVFLWDAGSGRQLLKARVATPVRSVAFSPDGRLLATGSGDYAEARDVGNVALWDVPARRLKRTLRGHGDGVRSLAFSPDGKTLATVFPNGIDLWETSAGRLKRTLPRHPTAWLAQALYTADGKTLVVATEADVSDDNDGAVEWWDAETGALKRLIEGPSEHAYTITVSADGATLGVLRRPDRRVRLWDLQADTPPRALKAVENYEVEHIALSPDGRILAGSGMRNKGMSVVHSTWLWDTQTGQIEGTLEGNSRLAAFSPDGTQIAHPGADGPTNIQNVRTGATRATMDIRPER